VNLYAMTGSLAERRFNPPIAQRTQIWNAFLRNLRNLRILFLLILILCLMSAGVLAQTAPEAFRNPPSTYRPSPFWSWNAALDDEELRWQVREFKDKGYGGYFMHSRVGLVTRYLSDEWFHKIGVCLEEGRKLGLESWLYDEDKWPSGFAGGLATHNRPEFVAMGMGYRVVAPGDLAQTLTDRQTLGLFDVRDTSFRRITSTSDKAQGQLVQFFAQSYQKTNWYNGEAYLDTLNPEAVAHFLKLTFTDGYDRRFRKDYGPAMPGVFTDEPNFQAGRGRDRTVFPWTRRFPEIFGGKRGYDLLEKLPLLTHPLPGFEQVRYDFWRTAAEQFEAAYSRQYGEMMGKLGLKLTGHYLQEDTLSSQTNVTGSVMLHYFHQQMPGIDHLMRNIANPLTLKQASSVAHQFGRERVLSEIYGVSGHSASFEDLKWVADFHYALGVNFLCPHLTLYSMLGDRKRDYPPTFSYHQPYWPYMKLLNDYLGRAAYFTSRGKSQNDILLLEPLGSAWAHWVPGQRRPEAVATLERRFTDTLDALLALHRDFDLGEEIILERAGRVENGELRVGPEGRYSLVVVPPAYRWNEHTAKLIDRLLFTGGKVIFRGPQPAVLQQYLTHHNAAEIGESAEELAAALEKFRGRKISIADGGGREISDILYQHRFDGIRHYFFLTNTSREKTHQVRIRVELAGLLEEWDLNTGDVRRLRTLERELPSAGSFAFAVDTSGTSEPIQISPRRMDERTEPVSGPYKFRRLNPNTLVLDWCRYSLDDGAETGPAPVWRARQAAFEAAGLGAYAGLQPWAMEWKGIRPEKSVRVRMRFEFESELDQPRAWLVLEKAGDFEVLLNGRPAGPLDGWHWDKQFGRLNIGSRIRRGANQIELSTVYKLGVEIEDIFLIGDFATNKVSDTKYMLVSEPTELRAGNWVDQGYHFYSGNMAYQVPVDFKPGERVSLRLTEPIGTALVVLAGAREVARLGWQPWEADVTAALRPGRNLLDVVVVSSLQNTFGPLHNDTYKKSGYNWWFGPQAFTDTQHWTDAYHHAPYGLGGVELVRSKGPAPRPRSRARASNP